MVVATATSRPGARTIAKRRLWTVSYRGDAGRVDQREERVVEHLDRHDVAGHRPAWRRLGQDDVDLRRRCHVDLLGLFDAQPRPC
jgi:hypothetical protein